VLKDFSDADLKESSDGETRIAVGIYMDICGAAESICAKFTD